MYSPTKSLLTLGLAALLPGLVWAQQTTPRPGQVPQPGQTPAAQPGQPAQAGQNRTTLPPGIANPLFRDPAVRRELSLTEQQFGRLNQTFDPLRTRFQTDFGRLGQLDESARAARLQELQRTFNTDLGAGKNNLNNCSC